MKIYNNNYSPNAKRVRVIAKELGITPEQIDVDFAAGQHKSPEYLAKNPMGKVPTYEEPGYVLWESPAIAWYLAAKHPGKGLLPTDARGQAETLRWAFWNASHYEASIDPIGVERVLKPMRGGTPDEARIALAQKDFDRYAPVLNAQLEGKTWLLGDTFTVADILLGTTTDWAMAAKIDFSRYPHIKSWHERLNARPSWKNG